MQYIIKHVLPCYSMVGVSTVNIKPEYSEKLGDLASSYKRSKTAQLEILIDEALKERGLND